MTFSKKNKKKGERNTKNQTKYKIQVMSEEKVLVGKSSSKYSDLSTPLDSLIRGFPACNTSIAELPYSHTVVLPYCRTVILLYCQLHAHNIVHSKAFIVPYRH